MVIKRLNNVVDFDYFVEVGDASADWVTFSLLEKSPVSAGFLEKHGFIGKVEKKGRTPKRSIEIALKYPVAISGLKRISKPGQRIYTGFKYIKGSKGGLGILIISTPKGLMTDKEAKRNRLGGEVICEIW